MKIAVMTTWNSACGVSIHSEILFREILKQHEVKIFAPINDGKCLPIDDEEYVIRNWEMASWATKGVGFNYFDTTPLLETEFDIFIVERSWGMPLEPLLEIFPHIKTRAKTVYIVHDEEDRILKEENILRKFGWDAVVYFDKRWETTLKKLFPAETIHEIPYPSCGIQQESQQDARKSLNLPQDKKIILNFGWRGEWGSLLPMIEYLAGKHNLLYLILTNQKVGSYIQNSYDFLQFRNETPSLSKIYEYLHASDVLILPKRPPLYQPVVSSTVYMCLGSLTPIVASDTEYVVTQGQEIIKYTSPKDLVAKLDSVFKDDTLISTTRESAISYLKENNEAEIAKKYIHLFRTLLKTN